MKVLLLALTILLSIVRSTAYAMPPNYDFNQILQHLGKIRDGSTPIWTEEPLKDLLHQFGNQRGVTRQFDIYPADLGPVNPSTDDGMNVRYVG